MRTQQPTLEWTIEQALSRCPRAKQVFTQFRMACGGCPMAPYETLAEAAIAHEIKPQLLLRELRPARRGKAAAGNER